MGSILSLAGVAVAIAGSDKLAGQRGYDRMFRQLGLSRGAEQAVAAAEISGGLLMAPRATRRLGGLLVAATSAAMLASELREGDPNRIVPRALVLLTGLLALAAPGRH